MEKSIRYKGYEIVKWIKGYNIKKDGELVKMANLSIPVHAKSIKEAKLSINWIIDGTF